MEYFIQQLINGITLGSIYGLIAIGYTMVYGIIGMINFAHGDIFMIGAFIALIAFILFGLTGVALPIILFPMLVFTYFKQYGFFYSSPWSRFLHFLSPRLNGIEIIRRELRKLMC